MPFNEVRLVKNPII